MNKVANLTLPKRASIELTRVAPSRDLLTLRDQLKAGYLANSENNLEAAAEWFPLEQEAWEACQPGRKARNKN